MRVYHITKSHYLFLEGKYASFKSYYSHLTSTTHHDKTDLPRKGHYHPLPPKLRGRHNRNRPRSYRQEQLQYPRQEQRFQLASIQLPSSISRGVFDTRASDHLGHRTHYLDWRDGHYYWSAGRVAVLDGERCEK